MTKKVIFLFSKFFFGSVLFLGISSCESEFSDVTVLSADTQSVIVPTITEQSKVEKDIINYIKKVKFNHSSARKSKGLNSSDYSLVPYIYENDTVFYIANYGSGWDLFSTDQRTPLIIMSSETGSFNPNSTTMPPAFAAYLESVTEELRQIKHMGISRGKTYGLWNTVSIQNEEVNPAEIEVATRAVGTQPGEGYWVLLETTTPTTTVTTGNRLTSTRWGQNSPWNVYVPFASGSTTQHCVAGCAAVAAAQYMYYLHYKNNRPSSTVSYGTYNQSSNEYEFSGSSTSIWDQMAKTQSESGTDKAALLIGHVGKSISTQYGNAESGAKIDKVIQLFNKEGGYNFSLKAIDYNYVINELKSGRAVYARATHKTNENNENNEIGHQFIIDRYRTTTTSSTNTYGWVGTDNLGNNSNEYDEEGNIVSYSFYYTKDIEANSHELTMNWGWSGYQDDVYCTATDNSDWSVMSDKHFNTNRQILK